MPLIEELPVTSTIKASHGWAYVPDTGPIAAQQPGTRDRKRTTAATSRHAASASVKQQKAIQLRLASLNRENYRDGVTVPIPNKVGSSAREKAGRKMTGNVRRILTYQRGFAHYLADEEANNPGGVHYQLPSVASVMAPPTVPTPSTSSELKGHRHASKEDGRRRSGPARTQSSTDESSGTAVSTPVSSSRGRKRGRTDSQANTQVQEAAVSTASEKQTQVKAEDGDVSMTDADTAAVDGLQTETISQPDYPPEWDNDPLLATSADDVPRMPSDKIMQLLMSEPPLTYNAARATPLDPEKQPPPRHFCSICGYWGKVKCKKCEEWTCGIMECWKAHEGVCAMANIY